MYPFYFETSIEAEIDYHRDDMFQEASRAIKSTYLFIALRNILVWLIDDIVDVNNGRFKILLDFSFDFLLIFAQGG